jgi:hypothetical protein
MSSRVPVKNCQLPSFALCLAAYAISASGVSFAGSTLMLTNITSSQPRPCSSVWSRDISRVSIGQRLGHLVKMKSAIQGRPLSCAVP